MWSPDSPPKPTSARSRLPMLAGGLAFALLASAGCTVQPLYASRGFTAATQDTARAPDASALPSVEVAPVTNREGLEVRNQLLFLLNGGARQPDDPHYTVTLTVAAVDQSSATIQVARDEEPTAAQTLLTARYVITDNFTEKGAPANPVVAQGRRQILSAYDVPRQEFAVTRAKRDARDRAAREMAELLRLAIAQDLVRVKRGAAPVGVPVETAPAVSESAQKAAASAGTSADIQ